MSVTESSYSSLKKDFISLSQILDLEKLKERSEVDQY